MVSYSEGDSSPTPSQIPLNGLHNPAPSSFSVMVPVYMTVTLAAPDALAAEVHAVEALRRLYGSNIDVGSGVVLGFKAIIAPVVS